MNRWQKCVNDMYTQGQYPESPSLGEWPDEQSRELAIELIKEEVTRELIPALESGDLVGTLDGACDSIWVILWALRTLGFRNLAPYYEEVARSNCAKILPSGPVKHPVTGKLQKPEGWTPPNIAGLLKAEMARAKKAK